MEIILVSCVGKKLAEPIAGADLYCSAWFIKARHYAETKKVHWAILSARYGLVLPNQVIAPYDETLTQMCRTEREAWARRTAQQIGAQWELTGTNIEILAGTRYREFLAPILIGSGAHVTVPMAHLRIGEQLAWLDKNAQDRISNVTER